MDLCRKGRIIKTTLIAFYGVTRLWADEANPQKLLELVRGYWAIETKQHHRRDHIQREDHCLVRNPVAARNLSLMRSAAIFLYEHQRPRRGAKQSQPDWQRKNIRNPNPLIQRLVRPKRTPEGRLGFPLRQANVPSGARSAFAFPSKVRHFQFRPTPRLPMQPLKTQRLGGLPQVC